MSYHKAFKTVPRDGLILRGNYILVERLERPEVKIGSIIMVDSNRRSGVLDNSEKPEFYRVIMTGEGYEDDAELEVKEGNIVLFPLLSVRPFSHLYNFTNYKPDSIGLARSSDAQMVFDNEEVFKKYFKEIDDEQSKDN